MILCPNISYVTKMDKYVLHSLNPYPSSDRCRSPAPASHLRLCLSSDGHHETFGPYAPGKGNAFYGVNLSVDLEKEHGFLKSLNHVYRGSVPSRATVFFIFRLRGLAHGLGWHEGTLLSAP